MMTKRMNGVAVLAMLIAVLVAGCSRDDLTSDPVDNEALAKNGTETLGAPDIAIAGGSGFIQAGVGLVGVNSGELVFEVPQGAAINQVLVYWAGGSTVGSGDNDVVLAGQTVTGDLIGGPTFFFSEYGVDYDFSAYRADITGLGLVQQGANSLTVSGLDFDTTGGTIDENTGCGIVVIYDDGSPAELDLLDGLDMAYFGFYGTIQSTVPQTIPVTAAAFDRTADLLLVVASVGEDRPNRIAVTTSAGETFYDDVLGSTDGMAWDSLILPITVPAGDTDVTVELVSVPTYNPQGASLGWVAAGLAIDVPGVDIGGTVFVDADRDGVRGPFEDGIPNVVLDIIDAQGVVNNVTTGPDGGWTFTGNGGTYTVTIDTLAHAGTFNEDLRANFAATTPLTVDAAGAQTGLDFGFVPVVERILADLDVGELISVALPLEYWTKVFRKAITAEQSGRKAKGHEDDNSDAPGWGHNENFPDPDELRDLLALIATLYQPDPYVFSPGNELREAYTLLKTKPGTVEENLLRELFVTELNYAATRGLNEEFDRLGVLIGWGETLLVTPLIEDQFAKGYLADLQGALRVFEAINTGGGGDVDE